MSDLESLDADAVIARLRLAPHPEGGHYREYFRDPGAAGAIYYLLRAGERSHWHRIDAPARISHPGWGFRGRLGPTGQESRAGRCGDIVQAA